jgi:polyphosphate glucokinase
MSPGSVIGGGYRFRADPFSLRRALARTRLGIDIGGTGIKGGIVDLDAGELISERRRVPTPQPSIPEAVAAAVAGLVSAFDYRGPIGLGFPAVVTDGTVWTANNIDKSWIGFDAGRLFEDVTGSPVSMVNDGDAAALCEVRYGVARDIPGVVLIITFGTGIGAGLINDGRLVPNLQIGDIELDGHRPAEDYFSAAARDGEGLSWEEWAERANRFLSHVKVIFSPRALVIGGGLTRHWDEWSGYLDPALGVVRASRANNAGIIGAATLVG